MFLLMSEIHNNKAVSIFVLNHFRQLVVVWRNGKGEGTKRPIRSACRVDSKRINIGLGLNTQAGCYEEGCAQNSYIKLSLHVENDWL